MLIKLLFGIDHLYIQHHHIHYIIKIKFLYQHNKILIWNQLFYVVNPKPLWNCSTILELLIFITLVNNSGVKMVNYSTTPPVEVTLSELIKILGVNMTAAEQFSVCSCCCVQSVHVNI